VPIPAVLSTDSNGMFEKDEDTGEWLEAIPSSYHDDWAVAVYSKVLIPELDKYLISEKTKYHNMPNGGNWNIKTK